MEESLIFFLFFYFCSLQLCPRIHLSFLFSFPFSCRLQWYCITSTTYLKTIEDWATDVEGGFESISSGITESKILFQPLNSKMLDRMRIIDNSDPILFVNNV